ncbi:MAG: hypothetical protein JW755_06445, partial [Candidatus Aminicenantes bacterium]|nr:hypothetical protein [Candidatus Aminicenantes bacterium]
MKKRLITSEEQEEAYNFFEKDPVTKQAPKNKVDHLKKKNKEMIFDGLESTTDLIRLYLKEIGSTNLLTKEGEIYLAQQIELGHNLIIRSLSRTENAMRAVLAVKEKIENDPQIIKDIFEIEFESEKDLNRKSKKILNSLEHIESMIAEIKTVSTKEKRSFAFRRKIIKISHLIQDLQLGFSFWEGIIGIFQYNYQILCYLEETRAETTQMISRSKIKDKAGSMEMNL